MWCITMCITKILPTVIQNHQIENEKDILSSRIVYRNQKMLPEISLIDICSMYFISTENQNKNIRIWMCWIRRVLLLKLILFYGSRIDWLTGWKLIHFLVTFSHFLVLEKTPKIMQKRENPFKIQKLFSTVKIVWFDKWKRQCKFRNGLSLIWFFSVSFLSPSIYCLKCSNSNNLNTILQWYQLSLC